MDAPAKGVLKRADFDRLLEALQADGRRLLGPTKHGEAIVFGPIERSSDLPIGWGDDQDAGRYRLTRRTDAALFGYAVGPDAPKRFVYPPERRLWRARKTGNGLAFEAALETPKLALLGVRPCDLAGLAVLDAALAQGPYVDAAFQAARAETLIVAVQCGAPAQTCFCASTETGPRAEAGFDLALTELISEDAHAFLLEAGGARGAAIMAALPLSPAEPRHIEAAADLAHAAEAAMTRRLETKGLPERLKASAEHPRWSDVAARCLACGACTQVCPTCFCASVEDRTDLEGGVAERVRRWDSCFAAGFSELDGAPARASTRARYRQWMTHKLSAWTEQFGMLGCVGCGRCVTWCPVGIDITEEAAAIQAEGAP